MATATTTTTSEKAKLGRRTIRKLARTKRNAKIVADKEFAKTYFEAKSKRSADKKTAFRKKKTKK
jgi:hypothetical protein